MKMKTKKIAKLFTALFAIIMLTTIGKQANATSYIMNLSTINNGDTVVYCPGFDTIMIIANGGNNNEWHFYDPEVILNNYSDTILVPNNITGMISNNNSITGSKYFFVLPLTVSGMNSTISCGNNATLSTTNNYRGVGTPSYNWLPVTGLDDPNIPNPVASPYATTSFVVTLSVDGCNVKDTITVEVAPMDAPEICIVGVNAANYNIIIWEKPTTATIDSFYIYKETTVNNVYTKIGSTAYADVSVFVDTLSHPDIQSNRYKISIDDLCNLESALSISHKTMHLTINQGVGNAWNLIWEYYEGFSVSTYNIYRGTSPTNLTLIGSIAGGGATQYTDNTAPVGNVYYQVEVIAPAACNPTKSYNNSLSNIATNNSIGITENINLSDLILIYPNPVTDKLQINSDLQIKNTEITEITGKQLYNTTSKIIDCSNFADGVYFIRLNTEKGIIVKRFVKE
jgi:trimeric autotransporter adhesin